MFPGQYYEKKQRARKTLKAVIISAIILGIAMFFAAMYLSKNDTAEVTKEVSVPPVVAGEKAAVEIKKLYRCGHMRTEVIDLPKELTGKTSDEIAVIMPEWHIIKFTKEVISVEEKIEKECDNHFFIKLNKNKLQAVKTNSPEEIYKELTISTNTLTKEDIEILTAGIDATSEYELLEIFESFTELN